MRTSRNNYAGVSVDLPLCLALSVSVVCYNSLAVHCESCHQKDIRIVALPHPMMERVR